RVPLPPPIIPETEDSTPSPVSETSSGYISTSISMATLSDVYTLSWDLPPLAGRRMDSFETEEEPPPLSRESLLAWEEAAEEKTEPEPSEPEGSPQAEHQPEEDLPQDRTSSGGPGDPAPSQIPEDPRVSLPTPAPPVGGRAHPDVAEALPSSPPASFPTIAHPRYLVRPSPGFRLPKPTPPGPILSRSKRSSPPTSSLSSPSSERTRRQSAGGPRQQPGRASGKPGNHLRLRRRRRRHPAGLAEGGGVRDRGGQQERHRPLRRTRGLCRGHLGGSGTGGPGRKKRRVRGGPALLPLQPRLRRAGEARQGEPRRHQAAAPSAAAAKAAQRQPVRLQSQPGGPDRAGQRRGRRRRSGHQSQSRRKPEVLEHVKAAKVFKF
ncbi:unnamed protein product, partial [Tetraodon nigroviridis]